MVDLNIQLPESFFHEEVRDGYLVSAKTKELWAVQLDILNEFDRVCKKYKLKYILDFGTLLGAIRHKGYIPWDDDVDVSMLREDYDKLMEIGPSEFKYPYFLQNQCTEKKFDGATTKLRRSDTTCLLTQNIKYHASYNQGIYIDIFVYDRMPYDKRIQESLHRESKRAFDYLEFASRKIRYGDDSIIKSLARYVYHRLRYGSRKKIIAWRESIVKRYEQSNYDVVGSVMFIILHYRSRESFLKTVEMPYENFMFPVPANYDEVLHFLYGDYMTPKIGTSVHSMAFFDTGRSYKEVLADKSKMKDIKKKLKEQKKE